MLYREIIAPCSDNIKHIMNSAAGVGFVTLKDDSHIACRAHAVPLPCRAAKGLECVFPI